MGFHGKWADCYISNKGQYVLVEYERVWVCMENGVMSDHRKVRATRAWEIKRDYLGLLPSVEANTHDHVCISGFMRSVTLVATEQIMFDMHRISKTLGTQKSGSCLLSIKQRATLSDWKIVDLIILASFHMYLESVCFKGTKLRTGTIQVTHAGILIGL